MKKNWKTTLSGIVAILIGGVQIVKSGGNVDETSIGLITVGIGQILGKDHDSE